MTKRFLVAVDFTELTERTVGKAAELAEGAGIPVDLLHVTKPVHVTARGNMAARAIADQAQRAKTESARAKLAKLVQTMPEAIRGNPIVETGIPADVICGEAEGYDMVVLATNGRTGLSHALLGSVAERVVRYCPVPVLVVR